MKVDGRKIAEQIFEDLKTRVKKLQELNITPCLAIILVGTDPASVTYVRQKEIKAKSIGIKTTTLHLSDKISQASLLRKIRQFNNDSNTYGIIVQQPLPRNIEVEKITESIDPKKDVDGFHSNSHFQVPIAMAVLKVLENVYVNTPNVQSRFREWLKNKKITVIGKGKTGGRPIIQMFKKMKIPFAFADSKTKEPKNLTKTADIVISAVGKPSVIKSESIKKGAILISIGLNKGSDEKLYGDYNEDEVKNIASFYTSTPGGVGPINVACLLKNLIESAENFSC